MRDWIDLQALFRHPFNSENRMTFRRKAKGVPLRGDFSGAPYDGTSRTSQMAAQYQIEREQLRIETIKLLLTAKVRGTK
jgi:hypothetical protein